MSQHLLTLGALTLGGSAAVAALVLAGRLTAGRYGAKWRCWAWLLLCLRLALPLPLLPQGRTQAPIQVDTPALQAPVVPSLSQAGDGSAPPSPDNSQESPAPPDGSQNTAPGTYAGTSPQVRPKTGPSVGPEQLLSAVWLTGTAAMLLWNAAAHLRFLSYLRRWSSPVTQGDVIQLFNRLGDQLELDRRPRLLACRGLRVPMLAGVIRPAILLPQGTITGETLGFSLLHELTHFRRRDIWLKTLAMWVNALYWFNPLMWYMVRLVERDTELACDEDALRRLTRADHAAYGQTILNTAASLQNQEEMRGQRYDS